MRFPRLIVLFLSMNSIAIVGTGRLAKQLFHLFHHKENTKVTAVLGRSAHAHASFNSSVYQTDFHIPLQAQYVFLAVSDAAVETVSNLILAPEALVCHVSGSVPLSALSSHQNRGVFYPLQTFGSEEPMDFKNIPLLVEANSPENEAKLRSLAQSISNQVQVLSSDSRKKLHLAAIMVNNFTNYLMGMAEDFCNNHQLDFKMLQPLMEQTIENMITKGAAEAQTGPARRGDHSTLQAHIELLDKDIEKEIYTTLSKAITQKFAHEL